MIRRDQKKRIANRTRKVGLLVGLMTIVVCVLLSSEPLLADTPFMAANIPGTVGEAGNLFILDQGFYARPLYNDAAGGTDKHLSDSMELGAMKLWQDCSLELQYFWRFITPAFRERISMDDMAEPVGRYADWMEVKAAWSKLVEFNGEVLRLQVTAGLGDIGDHGAWYFQRSFHRWINSSIFGVSYEDQPTGLHPSYGIELGLLTRESRLFGSRLHGLYNLGISRDVFMTDLYLNHNTVFMIQDDWRLGIEMRIIRQLESQAYGPSANTLRFESALGVRWRWYRSSVKYVSSYLRNDQVGQVYLDLLSFFLAF